MTLYGIKYGGTIHVSTDRKRLVEAKADLLEMRNFMGHPLNHVEVVDRSLLPVLEADGYRVITLL